MLDNLIVSVGWQSYLLEWVVGMMWVSKLLMAQQLVFELLMAQQLVSQCLQTITSPQQKSPHHYSMANTIHIIASTDMHNTGKKEENTYITRCSKYEQYV